MDTGEGPEGVCSVNTGLTVHQRSLKSSLLHELVCALPIIIGLVEFYSQRIKNFIVLIPNMADGKPPIEVIMKGIVWGRAVRIYFQRSLQSFGNPQLQSSGVLTNYGVCVLMFHKIVGHYATNTDCRLTDLGPTVQCTHLQTCIAYVPINLNFNIPPFLGI